MNVRPPSFPTLDPAFRARRPVESRLSGALRGGPAARHWAIALRATGRHDLPLRHPVPAARGENDALNSVTWSGCVKTLLWFRGGFRGDPRRRRRRSRTGIREIYSPHRRAEIRFGIHGRKSLWPAADMEVVACCYEALPAARETAAPLGRHLDGCRIGFDLGGSDRKCAAVIDGKVVFSEEIAWDPYFQSDPQYHFDGIQDTLQRAAAHLPRVDAIGGSAAGVYVNNEVRAASLFRGVSPEDFEKPHPPHLLRAARASGAACPSKWPMTAKSPRSRAR